MPEPRSSTNCELVALNLAVQHSPPQILTDSLAALLMLKNWGCWSSRRTLNCPDRVEVRQLLHAAGALEVTPALGKVKAHDEKAIQLRHPRAVGNDLAHSWAKRAATEAGHPMWAPSCELFADAVDLVDVAGQRILELGRSLEGAW